MQREEAEWIGLTLEEAVKKQVKLEHEAAKNRKRPLKITFAEELLDQLQSVSRNQEVSPDSDPG